jgi:hypothetical protein
MRSQDGSRIVAVDSDDGGAGSGIAVKVFDADSGNQMAPVRGNDLRITSLDLDTPTPSLSTDGRYVGVLRQVMRNALASPVPLGGKAVQPITRTIENHFELFDLQMGTVSRSLLLATNSDALPGAQVVPAPANGTFYVITRDGLSNEAIQLVVPTPAGLQISAAATNGQGNHNIPSSNLGLPMTRRVVDGSTLVRVSGNSVQWLDLKRMTSLGTVEVSGMGTNGARPSGPLGSAFSPDGSALFISAPVMGAVRAIDVRARAVNSSLNLPDVSGGDSLRGYFQQDSIALSERADQLYVLDGRTEPARLWTLTVPDLRIVDTQPVSGAGAVWVGADGTLYLLVRDRISVQAGTSVQPLAGSMAAVLGFVTSDRTWY